MRIEKSHIEHVESPEMTAASTLYCGELDPDFGSGNQHKALALALLVSEHKNIKKALACEQPMVIFENHRDGSIKTDRNGTPIASLTSLGRRMLALQRLPSRSFVEQMAPGITFPPYTRAIYTLIDDPVLLLSSRLSHI